MTYDKIVLNIPHASIAGIDESGWSDKQELIATSVKTWTDWHTDRLFNPSARNATRVTPHVFRLSRFACDAERLLNDPMEAQGEGILYTSKDGFTRTLDLDERQRLMAEYHAYINALKADIHSPQTLLIDCHSFPSFLSDVDICIGFNDDESCDEHLVALVEDHFSRLGYRVGINTPYSNALYPDKGFAYTSIMIELNKRIYLNEQTTQLLPSAYKVGNALNSLYTKLLKEFAGDISERDVPNT